MAVSNVSYDSSVIERLEDWGVAQLRTAGTVRIGGCGTPERHAACLWFAMKYGLTYDYDPPTGEFVFYY